MLAALVDLAKPLSFTIPGVLSPDECERLVARIEALGPSVAPVSRAEGPVLDLGTRNNARVIFDDPELAGLLFGRVRARVPGELMGMHVVGANERFRGYRYHPGQRFAPHYDGSFIRSETERSLLTLMVYLNEGFEGGETALLDLEETVVPRTGTALLFQHPLLHEGCAVTRGVKYALRSDVMYRRG
jgi:predicted 2-oxoglutarate/Fe(II)-dependent dioxygenase YbiX